MALEYISEIGSYDSFGARGGYAASIDASGGYVPPIDAGDAGSGDGDGGVKGYAEWEGVEGPFDSVLGVVQDLGRGFIQLKRDKLMAKSPGFTPSAMWSERQGLVNTAGQSSAMFSNPWVIGAAVVGGLYFMSRR